MKCNFKEVFEREVSNLEESIIKTEALIKALENIEILKTKDGRYFKNPNLGLKGAAFQKSKIGFDGDIELKVSYRYGRDNQLNYHASYEVDLYKSLEKEEVKQYEDRPGTILYRGPYIRTVYIYDISEWESVIKEEISEAKRRLEAKKISIELLKSQMKRVEGIIEELSLEVEKAGKEYWEIRESNHLRWALMELDFH